MYYKKCVVAIIAFILLFTTSCSFGMDTDALLKPPRLGGEYKDIQNALSEYVNQDTHADSPKYVDGYILKYPRTGNKRSAFIMQDLNGDGTEEAVVLYQSSKNTNARINILKKTNNQWSTIADFEGLDTEINRIDFADLSGLGYNNYIVVGWHSGISGVHNLNLYEYLNDEVTSYSRTIQYSEWVVDNFRNENHDDLLLLYIDSADRKCSASLWNFSDDGTLKEYGHTQLDSSIEMFTSLYIMEYPEKQANKKVLYADAQLKKGTITELIYWEYNQALDKNTLIAPLTVNQKNEITYRDDLIHCKPINVPNELSWPTLSRKTNDDKIFEIPLTTWNNWDFANNIVSKSKTYTYTNWQDGYYMIIGDLEWEKKHIALYDSNYRTLDIHKWQDGIKDKVLSIKALTNEINPTTDETVDNNQEQIINKVIELNNDTKLEVSFKENVDEKLTIERLSTIILPLQKEG